MSAEPELAAVIGLGMVGGSIAAGLKKRGWRVSGEDVDDERRQRALESGVIDGTGIDGATVVFVATPVQEVAACAHRALATGAVVTDVGSVKTPVVSAVDHPLFVGGHPMAGSERSGLDGVDVDLFSGATWVLTPTAITDPAALTMVREVTELLGARPVELNATEHDEMVATISHVPHLAASALMNAALERAQQHDALMSLVAGGFRDMTRIAAGHAGLWADITTQNRSAVVVELQRLEQGLAAFRMQLQSGNREALQASLATAADARRQLPERSKRPASLAVLHIAIPDQPGALGTVLGTLGTQQVNVEDIEITHDPSADRGALHLTVAAAGAQDARRALDELGFSVSVESL